MIPTESIPSFISNHFTSFYCPPPQYISATPSFQFLKYWACSLLRPFFLAALPLTLAWLVIPVLDLPWPPNLRCPSGHSLTHWPILILCHHPILVFLSLFDIFLISVLLPLFIVSSAKWELKRLPAFSLSFSAPRKVPGPGRLLKWIC